MTDDQSSAAAAVTENIVENLVSSRWCWDLGVAAHVGDLKVVQHHQVAEDTVRRNCRGWSAVMYASAAGHCDLLEYLLELAGRGGHEQEARSQAIDTAVNYNNLTLVSFLIDRGLVGSTELTSALLHAVSLGLTPVARHLIFSGADVNFTDAEGHSAMSLATEHGDAELVNLLFAAQVTTPLTTSAMQQTRGDITTFCSRLMSSMEQYDRQQTLLHFLQSVQLPQLWPVFHREEVDFSVFLGMGDLDLQSIGVRDAEARRSILDGQSQAISYFQQIFGPNVAAKLFR